MSDRFDITIVISSYNRDDKIIQTLQSLYKSDLSCFTAVELLIIDDGSPRHVEELLPLAGVKPSSITLRLLKQTNKGIGATRNRGFNVAQSSLVLFLDDDIILYPDTVQKFFQAWRQHQGALIFGSYPFNSYSSPAMEKFANRFFGYNEISKEEKIDQVNGITSGLLFADKSKLQEMKHLYNDNLTVPAAEEHELMFRFFKSGIPIYHARHIYALHNHHLNIKWLSQQQYKYGLATAEAFVKYPEIKGMKKFAVWVKSFSQDNAGMLKRVAQKLLTSVAGRKLLMVVAKTIEIISPGGQHHFAFGLLVSIFFKAGYNKGLRKFRNSLS